MMRYYMHEGPAAFRFELAGVLGGDDANVLEQDWRAASRIVRDRTLIIDMSFVTAIDERVRDLFRSWYDCGAQFAANSKRSRELVEQITERPFAMDVEHSPTYGAWSSLKSTPVAFLMMLALLVPAHARAAEDGASLAFGRFLARTTQMGAQQPGAGDVDVEIDASLPKLGKEGRFEAIRHVDTTGTPQYDVARSEGDATVKHQVIARYLEIEQQSYARPASLLAITPENYRFRYLASISSSTAGETGGNRFYVFEIKHRHRRDGLIDGQIWIDGETGVVVHQEGRVMKHASVFVRAIGVVRDAGPRVASPYTRVTRVDIETRMFGEARLTIRERPVLLSSNAEVQ